jgi:hypothetical protein
LQSVGDFISNMLGVRREGVTEGALKLQKAGLIKYARGRITVLDRKGLEKRTCECYAVVKREMIACFRTSSPHRRGDDRRRRLFKTAMAARLLAHRRARPRPPCGPISKTMPTATGLSIVGMCDFDRAGKRHARDSAQTALEWTERADRAPGSGEIAATGSGALMPTERYHTRNAVCWQIAQPINNVVRGSVNVDNHITIEAGATQQGRRNTRRMSHVRGVPHLVDRARLTFGR